MEKTMVFFCDIVGTFTGYEDNQKLRKEYISKVLLNIKQIQLKNNYDKIIFSFLSSDNHLENISKCLIEVIEISKELDLEIQMGKQFIINGYIDRDSIEIILGDHKSKPLTILKYIDDLNKTNDIKLLCYADDSDINHLLFMKIKKRLEEKTDYALFIPGGSTINRFNFNKPYVYTTDDRGIKGLNESLDNYIEYNNKKTYNIYTKK